MKTKIEELEVENNKDFKFSYQMKKPSLWTRIKNWLAKLGCEPEEN